jgi:hypothetical protein
MLRVSDNYHEDANPEVQAMKNLRLIFYGDRPSMIRQGCWGNTLMLGLVFSLLGGCSIWESYSHPDYYSSRAERICHPYGDCSQGEWVSDDWAGTDSAEVRLQCVEQIAGSHGNGWFKNSVSHGLEIGECMEKKGYVLRQP